MRNLFSRSDSTGVPRAETARHQVLRILVVEDDPALSQIITHVVDAMSLDLVVDVAASAAVARERLNSRSYDFVLLDYYLEVGACGTDLIEFIRQRQPSAGMAMMSSMELGEFIEVTADFRALQILPKPFSATQLKAFLFEVLEQIGSSRDARRGAIAWGVQG